MSQAALHPADHCPLCGQPNDCLRCTSAVDKDPCWCASVEIPAALLARVPPEFRNRNCICRQCVEQFQLEKSPSALSTMRRQPS